MSLINNIYWWSGAARKCTFRPRRPSKYAGSGAGSAGFRISLNQHECEFRPRGVLKSGRVPSGFRRVPNSADQQYREFRSRGVAKSGRAPNGFRRVPAAITINVVLNLCVHMRLPAPRSLCLLAPPSSSSSSWGPCPFVLGRRGPKIITKLGNWLARRFPILVIIFRWAPAEANAYIYLCAGKCFPVGA